MIKLVVTGPESSGKSTLSENLATHYGVPWVPEYARDYLNQLGRPYQEADLLAIAQGQIQREDKAAQESSPLLICDTSLLVIIIWSRYRYGRCLPWIEEQWKQRSVDHYLLCRPDLPWHPDPQRENPDTRDELFALYQQALRTKPHTVIVGKEDRRQEIATEVIGKLLNR